MLRVPEGSALDRNIFPIKIKRLCRMCKRIADIADDGIMHLPKDILALVGRSPANASLFSLLLLIVLGLHLRGINLHEGAQSVLGLQGMKRQATMFHLGRLRFVVLS